MPFTSLGCHPCFWPNGSFQWLGTNGRFQWSPSSQDASGKSRLLPVLQTATAAAKSLQSCPMLCNPIDSSPPGSSVPGILQARTLEWVAISFPSAWKRKVKVKSLCRVQLFVTPWTVAYQALPPMRFSRQEYWRGLPLPFPVHQTDWL